MKIVMNLFNKLIAVFVTVISCSCINNTIYYKSKSRLILATGDVSIKNQFNSLVIGHNDTGKGIHYTCPNLYVQGDFDEGRIVNLSNIDKNKFLKLKGLLVNVNAKSIYIPPNYKNVKCYKLGSLDIIRSSDNSVTLRVVYTGVPKDSVFIGTSKNNMKPIPMTKEDLIELFGEGEVFKSFNK